MKLTIVKYVAAVGLQFGKAPHYVEHTYEQDGVTVNFRTGSEAGVSTFCECKKERKLITVDITVPSGPGLKRPFGCELKNDADAKKVATAIRAAVEDFNTQASKDVKVEVV